MKEQSQIGVDNDQKINSIAFNQDFDSAQMALVQRQKDDEEVHKESKDIIKAVKGLQKGKSLYQSSPLTAMPGQAPGPMFTG